MKIGPIDKTRANRVYLADVTPDVPMSTTPRAHVCVLASLNYPDVDAEEAALIKRFTRVALTALVEVGASYELLDTTAALEDPGKAADFDGLLLLGGGDIDGACYGVTTPNPTAYGVDARADRDAFACH